MQRTDAVAFPLLMINQSRGGSPNAGLIMRSDSIATKRVSRIIGRVAVDDRLPAVRSGAIFARQRISSAIQLADAGESALQKQNRFDWCPGVTLEKSVEECAVERGRSECPVPPARHQSGADFP